MAVNVYGVRKKAYSKMRVLAWTLDLEKDSVVFCNTPKCPFMAFDIQEMALHYRTCFSFTESALSSMSICPVCKKGASCQTKLNNHMIKAHPTEAQELGIRDYTILQPAEVIKIPKITRESWKVLLEHKGYVKCCFPYCLFLTEQISEMEKHYGNCYMFCNPADPGLLYTCTTCGGRTVASEVMERHVASCHPVGVNANTPTNMISLDLIEVWTRELVKEKLICCMTKDCRYITDEINDLKQHYRFCRVPQQSIYSVCMYCFGWLSPNKLKAHYLICSEIKRNKKLNCSNSIGHIDKPSSNNCTVVQPNKTTEPLCVKPSEMEIPSENGFPKSTQIDDTSENLTKWKTKIRKASPVKESNDSNNEVSELPQNDSNYISNQGQKKNLVKEVVRKNGFSKMRILAWTHFLNRDGFILCSTPKCLFMAVNIQEMMAHFNTCFESTSFQNRLSMCKICERGLSNDSKLQNHMLSIHPAEAEKLGCNTYIIPEPSNQKPSKATKQSWMIQLEYKGYIKCVEPFCNFLSEDLVKMENHFGKCLQLFNSTKAFYTCSICNGRTIKCKDLNDHINLCHPPGTDAFTPTNKISLAQIEEWHKILKTEGTINCPTRECKYQTNGVDSLNRHYRFCKVSLKDIYSCQFCNCCLKSTGFQDHRSNCPKKQCDKNQINEKEKQLEISRTVKNPVQVIYDEVSGENTYSQRLFYNCQVETTSLEDHQLISSENECNNSQSFCNVEQIESSKIIEKENKDLSSRLKQRCTIKPGIQNKLTQFEMDLTHELDKEDMLISSSNCQKQYKSKAIKKQIAPTWPTVVHETDLSTKDIDLTDLETKVSTIKMDTQFKSSHLHVNSDLQRLENKFFQPYFNVDNNSVDIGPDLSDILNIPRPAEMQQNKKRRNGTKRSIRREKIIIKRTYNKSKEKPLSESCVTMDKEPEEISLPNKICKDDHFSTETMLQHLGNKIMEENISNLIPVEVSVNDQSWTVNIPPLEVAKKVVQRERHSYKLRTIYKKSFNQSQALLMLTNSVCTLRNLNATVSENRIEGRERIQNVENNVLLNKILSLKCQSQRENTVQSSQLQEPSQVFNNSNNISELLRQYAAEIELEQKSFTDNFDIDHLVISSDNESLNQLIQDAEVSDNEDI